MKKLIVLLALVFCLDCTKPEVVKELYLSCDCNNKPIEQELTSLVGFITFPRSTKDSYGIYITDFPPSEILPSFGVCTDSVFINLLRIEKIADSTIVKFSGGFVKGVVCRGLGPVRITSLKKI
jgi:hypothetical protein